MSDLNEAHAHGLIGHVPCYNSIFNVLGSDEVTPILIDLVKRSGVTLAAIENKIVVDSTGFSTSRFVRWVDQNKKRVRQQEWVKVHCATGTATHVVTAIVIKEPNASDSKQFPSLLQTTARMSQIGEILADKGYSSRKNLELVAAAGATPYILFRDNAVGRGAHRHCHEERSDL